MFKSVNCFLAKYRSLAEKHDNKWQTTKVQKMKRNHILCYTCEHGKWCKEHWMPKVMKRLMLFGLQELSPQNGVTFRIRNQIFVLSKSKWQRWAIIIIKTETTTKCCGYKIYKSPAADIFFFFFITIQSFLCSMLPAVQRFAV